MLLLPLSPFFDSFHFSSISERLISSVPELVSSLDLAVHETSETHQLFHSSLRPGFGSSGRPPWTQRMAEDHTEAARRKQASSFAFGSNFMDFYPQNDGDANDGGVDDSSLGHLLRVMTAYADNEPSR
ncbi:hypothetical protein BHM03_00048283 [Ensete ventricosum]|nr:hypothetical protein BHM03_00048283 [Ensete ventricosum]